MMENGRAKQVRRIIRREGMFIGGGQGPGAYL